MSDALSPEKNSAVDGTLLQVVIGVRELADSRLANAMTRGDQPQDLAEAWQIAQARFQELVRALRDNDLVDSLEDHCIVLGLVGPEIRYRAKIFDGLLRAGLRGSGLRNESSDAATVALQSGISILRTMSQLPEFGNCAEALAGFCEGLVAGTMLREAVLNKSATLDYD
jgi:hypothetical protein